MPIGAGLIRMDTATCGTSKRGGFAGTMTSARLTFLCLLLMMLPFGCAKEGVAPGRAVGQNSDAAFRLDRTGLSVPADLTVRAPAEYSPGFQCYEVREAGVSDPKVAIEVDGGVIRNSSSSPLSIQILYTIGDSERSYEGSQRISMGSRSSLTRLHLLDSSYERPGPIELLKIVSPLRTCKIVVEPAP